jgi:hypothetical protein
MAGGGIGYSLPTAPFPPIPFDRKIASPLSIRQAKFHAHTFSNRGGELISPWGAKLAPRPTIATAKTAGCMASEIAADLGDRASEAAGSMPGNESRQGLEMRGILSVHLSGGRVVRPQI